jgi:hypothetical protein
MFAAKFHTKSVAKILAIAGKDLGKPIKVKSLNSGKQVIGQTEEKIYDYLLTLGIPKRKAEETKTVGVIYTKYSDIPTPDLTTLPKNFDPSFIEVLTDNPKRKDVNPLRALN